VRVAFPRNVVIPGNPVLMGPRFGGSGGASDGSTLVEGAGDGVPAGDPVGEPPAAARSPSPPRFNRIIAIATRIAIRAPRSAGSGTRDRTA
jgi:hypothetical protein